MAQSASSSLDGRRGSKEADDKRQFLFDSIPVQETLQQNLIAQLNQTVLSADDRKTAELIVGNIDDDGFLQSTTEEMALNSGIPQDDFERGLGLIQTFYPAGVGARDLRECLLIQLRRQGKEQTSSTGSCPSTWMTWAGTVFWRSRVEWRSASRTCKRLPITSRD